MSLSIPVPKLSSYDPGVRSEGSLDPLGLYIIADGLGRKLVPGIRERMSHPRFLTAIAVALEVCRDFVEDDQHAFATDGASDAIQVFEWYLVEGMVRTRGQEIIGLPGRDKAVEANGNLNRGNYLKTPSVFGFYGIYKGLAREIGIETGAFPGETGYQLLEAWSREQGLQGFTGTGSGPGSSWRSLLIEAIRDGLDKASTARSGSWQGWRFFSDYLDHTKFGREESAVIVSALMDREAPLRRQMLEFITSEQGRKIYASTDHDLRGRAIHMKMAESSSPEMRDLLGAIMAFERFARIADDAFQDCLCEMSRARGKVMPASLAALESVKAASIKLPELYSQLTHDLVPHGLAPAFAERFESISALMPARDWVEQLLEHHRQVQRRKPPLGKAPWFDRFDDGGCIVRAGYVRDTGGRHDDSYVHDYRIEPLWSFAQDLGMVG